MIIKSFKVLNYEVRIGQYPSPAAIYCYGQKEPQKLNMLKIYFYEPGPTIAPGESETDLDTMFGTTNIPIQQYPLYIDLLRNEHPIWAMLFSDKPKENCLCTSREPVGEWDQ